MPRPGPRPYECVKRSWHSDLHQPIRGSIIQQIFRVAHENHSTGTKKNREWQQKLPLVVLKSEEIMYSKANSEAEYADPNTLWDRVNDAISTIIRKDETMETGEFLPPCVEAALNLGCVPVRTSKSQRNSNTRTYLSPQNQHPAATSPKTIDPPTNSQNSNLPERPNDVNQSHMFSETNRDVRQNYQVAPLGSSNFLKQNVPIESKASLASSSVYPLYYGLHFQPQNPRAIFHATHQNSNTIIVGTPVFQTAHDNLPRPLTSVYRGEKSSKNMIQEEARASPIKCDLSLRLGIDSSSEKGLTSVDDVDSGPSNSQSKEFSFFPLNSEGEQVHNLPVDVRKRKSSSSVNNDVVDGGPCFFQFDLDFHHKRRGF